MGHRLRDKDDLPSINQTMDRPPGSGPAVTGLLISFNEILVENAHDL